MSDELPRPLILIGTAGFKYDDWRGTFYPQGLPVANQLPYYAEHFRLLELNFTYYAMPSQRTMASFADRTGAGFCFAVKAHRSMTHEPSDRPLPEATASFRAAIEPLVAAGRLGAVLTQFPNSFRPTRENCDRLLALREGLRDVPVMVEFRHGDWLSGDMRDRVTNWLREYGMGLVVVDEPRLRGLVPPVLAVTGSVSYVRFHGRNAQQWYNHDHAWQRYDYLYSQDELAEWVQPLLGLASQAQTTMVVFNNHYAGSAPRNAVALRELLQSSGSGVEVR